MFAFSDKGICYFAGEGDAPRSCAASTSTPRPPRRSPCAHAACASTPAPCPGTRSGQDTPTPRPSFDLLADIARRRAVSRSCGPRPWSPAWRELRPDVYGPWGGLEPDARAAQLTAALRPYGVRTGQVWGTTDDGKGANRRGITRDDITNAITDRDGKRGPGRAA